jgi:hypothetical protein
VIGRTCYAMALRNNGTWRLARTVLVGLIATTVALVLILPWLLYAYALSLVPDFPKPTARRLTEIERLATLRDHRMGTDAPMTVLSPYVIYGALLNPEPYRDLADRLPGLTLASYVASTHLRGHPRQSFGAWHVSNAGLAVWLSRNWSKEQLLAYAATANQLRREHCKATGKAWNFRMGCRAPRAVPEANGRKWGPE